MVDEVSKAGKPVITHNGLLVRLLAFAFLFSVSFSSLSFIFESTQTLLDTPHCVYQNDVSLAWSLSSLFPPVGVFRLRFIVIPPAVFQLI